MERVWYLQRTDHLYADGSLEWSLRRASKSGGESDDAHGKRQLGRLQHSRPEVPEVCGFGAERFTLNGS